MPDLTPSTPVTQTQPQGQVDKGSNVPVPASKTPAPPADTKATSDASLTIGSKDTLATQTTDTKVPATTSDEPLFIPNHPTTQKNKSELIKVIENVGGVAGRTWRGVCRKCGWQTHQPTKANARDAVAAHVDKHAAPVTDAEPTPSLKQAALAQSKTSDKTT